MLRKSEYLSVFLLGGVLYGCLELLWRGYTHPSMTFAGGLCLLVIHLLNGRMGRCPFLLRCVLYSLLITAVELAVGLVVNRWLGLGVWDYSAVPGNVLGQICPAFTFLWFLVSIPASFLSGGARRFFDLLSERERAEERRQRV